MCTTLFQSCTLMAMRPLESKDFPKSLIRYLSGSCLLKLKGFSNRIIMHVIDFSG